MYFKTAKKIPPPKIGGGIEGGGGGLVYLPGCRPGPPGRSGVQSPSLTQFS